MVCVAEIAVDPAGGGNDYLMMVSAVQDPLPACLRDLCWQPSTDRGPRKVAEQLPRTQHHNRNSLTYLYRPTTINTANNFNV